MKTVKEIIEWLRKFNPEDIVYADAGYISVHTKEQAQEGFTLNREELAIRQLDLEEEVRE